MTNQEREYVYEVGLTNEDRERIYHMLGVHCLSLEDYDNVSQQIGQISDTINMEDENGNE